MEIHEIIENNIALSKVMKNIPPRIKATLVHQVYKPNSIIFYKGDYLKYIYILYDGEVRVSTSYKDGYIFEITRNDTINFMGEQAVLAGANIASVTISAATTAKVLLIKTKYFLEWIKADNDFAFYLLENISKLSYYNAVTIGSKGYLTKKQLLQQYFCNEFEKSNLSIVTIDKTRQAISECIGASLRSVERCVTDLKNRNLITVTKRKISINQLQYSQLIEELSEIQ